MIVSVMRKNLILVVFFSLCLGGCDNAVFSNSRQVGGDYYLQQWEDSITYYIEDKTHLSDFPGSGAIGGTVVEIGWDESKIIVLQKGVSGPDGWVMIDIATKKLSGPYQDRRVAELKIVADLKTMPAKLAWNKLCEKMYFCW